MKKRIRKIAALSLTAVLALSILGACGKKEEETSKVSSVSPAPVVEEEPEPVDEHPGQTRSPLTGQWIDEELAAQRPIAVMESNNRSSLPQYGLSQADVIYEATMEGEETRFMLVIQDWQEIPMLMPIRSCRQYFLYWALGVDAIYVHYGQAYLAKEDLAKDDVYNLNGMDGDLANVTFFRDNSRKAPQNAYATGESIMAGVEKRGYSIQHKDDFESGFKFNEDDENEVVLSGENVQDAYTVDPGYQVGHSYFVYDEAEGLYKRFQFDQETSDGSNDEQVAVKNILFQIADYEVLDEKGRLRIDMMGTGDGYYVTNGKVVPITWEKADKYAPVHYYYTDGTELELNQGKTFICNLEAPHVDQLTFTGPENNEGGEEAAE